MADPINPKVPAAALGAGVGVGMGKVIANALASFGLLTPEQAEAVAPVLDILFSVGGAFLGGYLRTA